jgi:sugar-specific transcriptional regulator TrmB
MPKGQTEDTLKALGLTPYETKCYLALLQRGTLTVPEVSTIAGVPRSNAYDALEKMMSKGICVSRPGNTKRYSASPPDLLRESFILKLDEETESELHKFKRDQRTALKEKEKEVLERKKAAEADITRVMKDLQPDYEKSRKQTDPLDYIEIIKDPYLAYKRFSDLIGQSKEEMICFVKPPFASTKEDWEEEGKRQNKLMQKGVRIRTISEIPKDNEIRECFYRQAEEGGKFGLETRTIKELPMKMAVFDSRTVTLSLEDPISGQVSLTTLVIKHRALAQSLKLLFDSLWEQAQDYHILEDSRR